MSTAQLMERLLDENVEGVEAIAALHGLLDDAAIDAEAAPVGVARAAALTGLSAHTLRYYERAGLVRPDRDASGYRSYAPAHLRRLVFLTRMRASGMPMSELTRYIALVEQGTGTIDERRAMMIAQRERLRRHLRETQLALAATEYKIRVYGGSPG